MTYRGPTRRRPLYDLRESNGRWSIHDLRRGTPVVLGGKPQVDLDLSEAEELNAVLNRLQLQQDAHQAGREGD